MRRDTVLAKIKNIDGALDKREEPPLLVVLFSPDSEESGAYVGLESGNIYEGCLDEITPEQMISLAGHRVISVCQFCVHGEEHYMVPDSRFSSKAPAVKTPASVKFDPGVINVQI